MKHLTSTKALAACAIALGALAAASSAHAGSDVTLSIGVQVPGVYVQAVPVYVQPRPIYRPAPIYYGRYDDGRRHEAQRWQGHGPAGYYDRNRFANVYSAGGPRNQWRQVPSYGPYGPYGDLDRDGIRNKRDRDIDGDGVRNRYDRAPIHPNRR